MTPNPIPPFWPLPLRDRRWWLRSLIVAVVMALGIIGGLELAAFDGKVSLVWAPSGIAAAVLLRWGLSLWPALWLGQVVGGVAAGIPLPLELAIATSNIGLALIGARLSLQLGLDTGLMRRRDVALYLLVQTVAVCALVATLGVTFLWLAGALPTVALGGAWLSWWIGDAVGVLLVGVPLLTAQRAPLVTLTWRRGLELLGVVAALAGVALFAFIGVSDSDVGPSAALFVPFALIAWLALRFGVFLASAVALPMAAFVAWATLRGSGPFTGGPAEIELIGLWGYMATLAVLALLINALVQEQSASERRLMALFVNSQDGILLTRPDGTVMSANPAACRMLGMTAEEIKRRGRGGLVDPTDTRLSSLMQARARDGVAHGALRFVRGDGSRIELELHSTVYASPSGDTLSHIVLRDPSPLRRAAEDLTRSEQRLQMALEGAELGLWDLDLRTRQNTTNERWSRMLGYAPDELANTLDGFRALLYPGDWERLQRALDEHVGGRSELVNVEVRMRHKDGGWRWVLDKGKVIERGPDGAAWRAIGTHMDITDRKLAEEKVMASEQHFRLMANAAPVLIWTANRDKDCDFFNDYWLEFTGRTLAQEIHGGWENNVHPDDLPGLLAQFSEAFEARRPYVAEYRMRRHDGEYRTMLERGLPRYAGGQFDGFIGSCVDITEMKLAQRELAASEARFKAFMDHSPAIAWINEADGRMVYINAAYERIFGISADAVVGRLMSELYPPETAREYLANSQHALANGRPIEVIESGVRGDGSPAQFLVVKFPLPAADGRSLLGGIGLDITERQQDQDALRASETRLRMVLEGGEIGVWEWDPATDLAVWDERLCALMGVAADVPKTNELFMQQVHEEDRERLQAALARALAERREFSEEFRILRKDGVRWLAGRGRAVYGENGQVTRMFGVNFDITARREAQQALIIAETAERANRAKTEFLSRMSHELRTPLNAVLGFAQLLQLDRTLARENIERATQIVTAGQHLLAMINDVLDLSRIEAGRMAISLEPVEVRQPAREALALVGTMAARASITLVDSTFTAAGVMVRADRVRLHQVLFNLLSNAIKYNHAEGQVTLRVDASADEVRLRVIDTGRGLTPAQCERLFEPFNRLGAENTAIEGTGIGLTVSKGLVELMDGRIEVKSEPGKGSEFTVVLPRVQAAAAPAPAGYTRPATLAPVAGDVRRVVLYAEDNDVNVQVVRQAFALNPSLRLVTARNGAQALALARRERPDLLLVDMHLGDMLGLDVRAQLESEDATRGIPSIVLSADAMPDQIRRAREAGFIDYLTKPFEVRELLARIDAVVNAGDSSADRS